MKIRKNIVTRMISASVIMCTTIAMTVFPSYAEDIDNINSKGNIVLDVGDVAFYAADASYLQDELDNLYQELPEQSNSVFYGTARKSRLNSKGIIDYADGTVVIDSSDFAYLADEIDSLEAEYKANTVAALNTMGTFFLTDGSINHDLDDESFSEESTVLSFEKIYEGIKKSQSVDHLAGQGISASIADNLSKNTAAWVDGELIIGNGADNNAYYKQGFIDGQLSIYDKVSISYVYHVHTGTPYVNGGCITAWHTHDNNCASHKGERCGASLSEIQHIGWVNEGDGGRLYCKWMCSNGHIMDLPHDHQGHCNEAPTIYDCGDYPLNRWSYNCGKTTSTIESATIVFND